MKNHYYKNKVLYIKRAKESSIKRQKLINNIKNVPCLDCGVLYPPYVMDFDHKKDKKFNIASKKDCGLNRLMEEINKCDIVCANCHRIRTHKKI